MAQVIAADVRICGLPYAKIFDVRRSGHDGGTQIFGGDQVTLRGIESVRTALATAITALRSQLDGLDEDDPRYWQVLDELFPAIDQYKKVDSYVKQLAHLHFGFHQAETVAHDTMLFLLWARSACCCRSRASTAMRPTTPSGLIT